MNVFFQSQFSYCPLAWMCQQWENKQTAQVLYANDIFRQTVIV